MTARPTCRKGPERTEGPGSADGGAGANGLAAPRRADQAMVAQGLVPSRARAQAEIKAGTVFLDGKPLRRPSDPVPEGAVLDWRDAAVPYVSRGGLKLAHALQTFDLCPKGLIALDLGASTGGFTDVLLRGGARQVFAVDVGHGQLHPDLAADARVVCLERLNVRDLTSDHLQSVRPKSIVCDVSFISLTLALPPALDLASPGAWVVALIKPQFEVGRDGIGKGGVVRDAAQREAARAGMMDWLASQPDWSVLGCTESSITGPNGNIEYLAAARKAK